jgi:hypothetical protein
MSAASELIPSGMPDPDLVRKAEAFILTLPQVDLQTRHEIHAGVSTRAIFVPAGTHVTGAQTNLDNTCIVFGDITVTTDEGPKRLTGFHVIKAKAGAKRYGVAHADTWWITVHHTTLTDQKAVENEMTIEADMLQTRRDGIVYQGATKWLSD